MRPIINSTVVSLYEVMNHMDERHFTYINKEFDQLTYRAPNTISNRVVVVSYAFQAAR